MASVEIRNLEKSYGIMPVLKDISIDVENGQFVVLVGPSGCGKSTLLRMIAGLESITSGEILIDGEVMNRVPPKERNIAMVFQNYALYPHMTVAENMGFSLKLKKMAKADISRKVDEAAGMLGLGELLDRRPAQLSGGQRQRVAMGRALVRDPQVFLFDEPLSNLDAKLRVQMRMEIKALHQRLGVTTVYVTHDQIEALTMADKIVLLNGGGIAQMGTPLELYDFPANTFVAGFIGSPSMNFLPGTVTPDGFICDGGGASLPLGRWAATAKRGRAIYGIRPEHLMLDPEGGVPVEAVVIEPAGSETQFFGRLGNEEIIGVFRERLSAKPGELIRISPDPDSIHLFDCETGNRL